MPHALQQGHEAIVVGRRDRVELMVVAAGARERRAEEGGGRGPDHVVQLVGPLVGRQHRVGRFHAIPRTTDEEAGRGVRAELIAGELIADEPVVGQVGVERLDDVVAVRPGVGAGEVGLETIGLGEARHVQPMAGPFLAEPRRGQQPVDHRRIGLVRRVGDERRDLRGRGRQAGDVEGGAADERARVGGGRPLQTFRSESGLDEVVDAGAGGRSADGLISPVVEPRVPERGAVGGVLGPERPFRDPRAELCHLRGRERVALRGHLLIFVGGGDPVDERGLGGIAGDERRAGFAAFEGVRAGVESQVRFRLLRSVTFHATLLQQGADLGVEIHCRAQGGRDEQHRSDG